MGVSLCIAVTGKAGAGKDSFANCLRKLGDVARYAHADVLKDIAANYFGMEGKDRKLLQDIGNGMRTVRPDIWVETLYRKMKHGCYIADYGAMAPTVNDLVVQKYDGSVVITDMRFPNEYDFWVEKMGFFPVKIVCPDELRLKRLRVRDGCTQIEALDDVSESHVDNMNCFTIDGSLSLDKWEDNIGRFIYHMVEHGHNRPSLERRDIPLAAI